MAEVLVTCLVSLFLAKFVLRPLCITAWFWKEMDSRLGLSTRTGCIQIFGARWLSPRNGACHSLCKVMAVRGIS